MKVKELKEFIQWLCATYNGGVLEGSPYELVPFKERDKYGGRIDRGVRLIVKDDGAVFDSISIVGHEPEDWGSALALDRALKEVGIL